MKTNKTAIAQDPFLFALGTTHVPVNLPLEIFRSGHHALDACPVDEGKKEGEACGPGTTTCSSATACY